MILQPRTIDCPICGRELGIAPHVNGRAWMEKQIWLVAKLDAQGIPPKVIARVLGGNLMRKAMYDRITKTRHRKKPVVKEPAM